MFDCHLSSIIYTPRFCKPEITNTKYKKMKSRIKIKCENNNNNNN